MKIPQKKKFTILTECLTVLVFILVMKLRLASNRASHLQLQYNIGKLFSHNS